ncbi:MAG: guanylate kinase [Armatimonadota bacterium]|nr:MAG: guanylate kinase [Armatimonadota bacterium]
MNTDSGFVIVISGPSGVGKGAIADAAMKRFPRLQRSVSATTRAPRAGEVEGKHYFFRSGDEFRRMAEGGELVEWTTYLDDSYGTPRAEVDRILAAGNWALFEIDVVGGRSIRAAYSDAVLVFVAPPSWDALAKRLAGRQSETEGGLARRLEVARREIECAGEYDYVIINDRLDDAVDLLCAIVRAEQARPSRVDLNRLREQARAKP